MRVQFSKQITIMTDDDLTTTQNILSNYAYITRGKLFIHTLLTTTKNIIMKKK